MQAGRVYCHATATNRKYERGPGARPSRDLLTRPLWGFAAGSLAGALAQLAIYPLEITKTRLAVSAPGEYGGILDCVRTIVRKEGVAAVFAGLGTSTAGIIPYAGTDLAVYSFLKDEYARRHPDTEPPISVLLGCGAACQPVHYSCKAGGECIFFAYHERVEEMLSTEPRTGRTAPGKGAQLLEDLGGRDLGRLHRGTRGERLIKGVQCGRVQDFQR